MKCPFQVVSFRVVVSSRLCPLSGYVLSGLCPSWMCVLLGYVSLQVVSSYKLCLFRVTSLPGYISYGLFTSGLFTSGLCPSGFCHFRVVSFRVVSKHPFLLPGDLDQKECTTCQKHSVSIVRFQHFGVE